MAVAFGQYIRNLPSASAASHLSGMLNSGQRREVQAWMGAAMMRMKATIEVEFQIRRNVDDDVLRATLFRGVREMGKAIQQG
jgi:hypothetical protein